jgi:hypothetical protein
MTWDASRAATDEEERTLLSAVLKKVTASILENCEQSCQFMHAVSGSKVHDYHHYVHPQQEMYLSKVLTRINCRLYTSAEAFFRDIQQICLNAVSYNSEGGGDHGHPSIILYAQKLVEVCRKELDRFSGNLLQDVEHMVRTLNIHVVGRPLAPPR